MNLKRKIIVAIALSFAVGLVLLKNKTNEHSIANHKTTEDNSSLKTDETKTDTIIKYGNNNIHITTLEERERMTHEEKIALFERLGYVPPGFGIQGRILAEKTSWWGKRLDPEEFWKNRPIWYDHSAEYSARIRGRGYPPMPYDDPSIHDRSDDDRQIKSGFAMDGGTQPRYVSSEREGVFWSKFSITHPRPPQKINERLAQNADSWLGRKQDVENNQKEGKSIVLAQKSLDNSMFIALRDVEDSVFPIECITPEAFHWDYVMRKRVEYEAFVASGRENDEMASNRFFDRVLVDRTLITEPLTDEQIDAANAWKVAYLKRLRSEEWDELYINAYLQAWDLTEEYVFKSEEVQVNEN